MIHTHRMHEGDLWELDESLVYAPCILQERIAKKAELRLTVVGESIFAAKLNLKFEKALYEDMHLCTSEDDIFIEPFPLEENFVNIRDRILTFMNEFGFAYGSIDFIIDKNDQLIFLEVNPSGDWAYIEERTGLPITQSITYLITAETMQTLVLDE